MLPKDVRHLIIAYVFPPRGISERDAYSYSGYLRRATHAELEEWYRSNASCLYLYGGFWNPCSQTPYRMWQPHPLTCNNKWIQLQQHQYG